MRELVWSEEARIEFRREIAFIAQDDPYAARLVGQRISDAALKLQEIHTGRSGRVDGTFEKSVYKTSYIIAYAMTEEAITILRVIHSSRLWLDGEWPQDNQSS